MVPPEPDGHRSISANSSGARCSEGGLPMSRRCRPGEWKRLVRMEPIEPSRKSTMKICPIYILNEKLIAICEKYGYNIPNFNEQGLNRFIKMSHTISR